MTQGKEPKKQISAKKDIERVARAKLEDDVKRLFTEFFGGVLSLVQVSYPRDRWKFFRSQILTLGNDKVREFKDIMQDYRVFNLKTGQDIIVNKKETGEE